MGQRYTISGAVRGIVVATVVAGTLDLLSAFAFAAGDGASPLGVLGGIGGAVTNRAVVGDPWAVAAVGLALHFAITGAMAATYFALAAASAWPNRLWVLNGLAYGIALWALIDRVILPTRWPTLFPLDDTTDIAEQLFDHVLLVGLPIAMTARHAARWRG